MIKLDIFYDEPQNKLKEKCSHCGFNEFNRVNSSSLGLCKKCNSENYNAVIPEEECFFCGCKTFYTKDENNRWFCSEHWNKPSFSEMSQASQFSFKEMEEDGQGNRYHGKWKVKEIYEFENGNGSRVVLVEKKIILNFKEYDDN